MTNQLLAELKSLDNFLVRNLDAFDYNSYVLNPDNDGVELVITRKQLKLLQNAISGWIYDIKEEEKSDKDENKKSIDDYIITTEDIETIKKDLSKDKAFIY